MVEKGLSQEVKSFVERLNGTKILPKGNHDFKIGTNTWKEIGFFVALLRKTTKNYCTISKKIENQ